jgi:hypothetical protein
MADIVAVSTIQYGYEEDNDGIRHPVTKSIGDKLTTADFSEKDLKDLIACGAAVDLSGEMQELVAVPFVDQETAKRDELLQKVGAPILVDTSNPTNRGVPAPKVQQTDAMIKAQIAELQNQLDAKAQSEESTKAAQAVNKQPIGSAKK